MIRKRQGRHFVAHASRYATPIVHARASLLYASEFVTLFDLTPPDRMYLRSCLRRYAPKGFGPPPLRISAEDWWRTLRTMSRQLRRRTRALSRGAQEAGRLLPKACQICQRFPTHQHHENYLRPMEVTWLCQHHHVDRHKDLYVQRRSGAFALPWMAAWSAPWPEEAQHMSEMPDFLREAMVVREFIDGR